jgi:hypothetical protein
MNSSGERRDGWAVGESLAVPVLILEGPIEIISMNILFAWRKNEDIDLMKVSLSTRWNCHLR